MTLKAGVLHAAESTQHTLDGLLIHDGMYPPLLDIKRHDHELASVCVVLAGSYDESLAHRQRLAVPGMVIVHPAGEHHADRHLAVRTRIVSVEIANRRLAEFKEEAGFLDESWHRKDDALALFGLRIGYEVRYPDAVSTLAAESLVLELVAATGLCQRAERRNAHWLLRVRDYLEEHTSDVPSMDCLAQVAGVHRVHVARAFRHAFGCSVGGYARRLQVARAIARLQGGDEPLAAVADDIGFADQSHMTRMVRAQTGLTPGVWRSRR